MLILTQELFRVKRFSDSIFIQGIISDFCSLPKIFSTKKDKTAKCLSTNKADLKIFGDICHLEFANFCTIFCIGSKKSFSCSLLLLPFGQEL